MSEPRTGRRGCPTRRSLGLALLVLTISSLGCGEGPRKARSVYTETPPDGADAGSDVGVVRDMAIDRPSADMNPADVDPTRDFGPDQPTVADAGPDASASMDMATDMRSLPDMAMADMPAVVDMPPAVDMAPDMPAAVDMPPDMPAVVDMAPDMPTVVDMAPDMPAVVDMAPDMPTVVDMAPDMPTVVDMAPDMPPPRDMDRDMPPPRDMGPDMPTVVDVGPDAPPDMDDGTGITCPYTDLTPFSGPCDPVDNIGCAPGFACVVIAVLVGPNVVLTSECQSDANYTLPEGATCGVSIPELCAPTLQCINFDHRCYKLCYNDDAYGCAPDEYCRRPSVGWGGLGFCDDTCNL